MLLVEAFLHRIDGQKAQVRGIDDGEHADGEEQDRRFARKGQDRQRFLVGAVDRLVLDEEDRDGGEQQEGGANEEGCRAIDAGDGDDDGAAAKTQGQD